MTAFSQSPEDTQERLEAAAAWRLRISERPALEMSPEFHAWLGDARNLRAFEAVETSWANIEEFGTSQELLQMRRAALNRIHPGRQRWLPWIGIARRAAALLLVAILGGGVVYFYLTEPDLYTTGTSERRQVQLSDGSRIWLDSDTWVRAKYTKTARTLILDHGRARFDVAHDVTRPFSVTAGQQTVIAVGTSFDVERLDSKVLVTMIQGKVRVRNATSGQQEGASVPLSVGQELIAVADQPFMIKSADLRNVTAWEAGHLVFKDEALSEAVERVNRYTQHPIMVDPAVAAIRVSGVFNAGDVKSFVSAVTSYLPVQAAGDTDNSAILQSRP